MLLPTSRSLSCVFIHQAEQNIPANQINTTAVMNHTEPVPVPLYHDCASGKDIVLIASECFDTSCRHKEMQREEAT